MDNSEKNKEILEQLREIDKSFSERLSYCLDTSKRHGVMDGRNKLDVLRSLDTSMFVSGDAILRSSPVKAPFSSFFYRIFDLLRNVLILSPIALTWYSLSEALNAYANLSKFNSQYLDIPFIVLWQEGFFSASFDQRLTFGAVAKYDSFLIIGIIFLTILTFLAEKRAARKTFIALSKLKTEVDSIIWEKEQKLVAQVSRIRLDSKSINGILQQFDQLISEIYKKNLEMQDKFKQLVTDIQDRDRDNSIRLAAEYGRASEINKAQIEIVTRLDDFSITLNETAFQVVDTIKSSKELLSIDADQGYFEDTFRELSQQKVYFQQIIDTLDAIREIDNTLLQQKNVHIEKMDVLVRNTSERQITIENQTNALYKKMSDLVDAVNKSRPNAPAGKTTPQPTSPERIFGWERVAPFFERNLIFVVFILIYLFVEFVK